jgi:hypothetical protein
MTAPDGAATLEVYRAGPGESMKAAMPESRNALKAAMPYRRTAPAEAASWSVILLR